MSRMLRFCYYAVIVGGVGFGCTAATAATIHVPSEYPTIQAGIDAAMPADTVLVEPGLYTGPGNRDLDFGGTNLVLLSLSGADVTIIDCEGSMRDPHRGFLFHSGETANAIVDGFTIRGGWTNHSDGAGVYCDGASPTIRNCVITLNVVSDLFYDGGGVYLRSSAARIESCRITENRASYGGGIACRGTTTATITNCEILRNECGYGGGIDAGGIGSPRIIGCLIAGNDATDGFGDPGSGGGLVLGGDARVENCVVIGNVSGHGAGVAAWSGTPVIIGSTIAGNDAQVGKGGGVSTTTSDLHIERSVLWGNCAADGMEFHAGGGGILSLYCCVYDSAGATQDGGQFIDLGSNVTDDPLFCLPEPCSSAPTTAGDYSVDRASPCYPENNPCEEWIGALRVGCPASDIVEMPHPDSFTLLSPPFPNPSTGRISCTINLSQDGHVSASVFDPAGRRIATILDRHLPAGRHPFRWDPAGPGRRLSGGVYILRLERDGYVESRNFLITR